MKKSLIAGETIIKRKWWITAASSFFLPGLGHAYCGEWARGIVFPAAISLFAVLTPFSLITNPELPSLRYAITMCAFCTAIYFITVIDAIRICAKKNRSNNAHPVHPLHMIAFSLISLTIIASSLRGISACYSIATMADESMEPSFFQNEILLIASLQPATILPGDAVLFKHNGAPRIGRIIAREGARINSKDGMMEINGTPSSIGIVLADEIASRDLRLKDELFYEVSGNRKYPLHISPARRRTRFIGPAFTIPPGHFAIAFDNRLHEKNPLVIASTSIIGRVEGIIIGKTWKRNFLPPFDML